jgi:hypothetical protein
LEATDLIEVSTIESGSYVTRSITGQELIDAIPLPPTGLTVGTTPIASGTIGRVLFEGTGNVLQQSSSLFWDSTNNRLGIGTSTPLQPLHVTGRVQLDESIILGSGGATNNQININATGSLAGIYSPSYNSGPTSIIQFKDWAGVEGMRLTATRNLLINTTTDAGFRLDVNGTARINTLTIGLGGGQIASNTAIGVTALNANTTATQGVAIGFESLLFNTTGVQNTSVGALSLRANTTGQLNSAFGRSSLSSNTTSNQNTGFGAYSLLSNSTGANNTAVGVFALSNTNAGNNTAIGISAGTNNTSGANNIFIGALSTGVSNTDSNRTWIGNSTTTTTWLAGNVLINTTTDAGFRLDVNGTARVGNASVSTSYQRDLVLAKTQAGYVTAMSVFNGSATGITGFYLGEDNTSIAFNFKYGSGISGNWSGTSLAIANTYQIATGTSNNLPLIIQGTPIVLAPGITSTNIGVRHDANCFKIGTLADVHTSGNASAAAQIDSTTKGFLPPRMTTTQRNAIASPAAGLMVYDTTLNAMFYFNGTIWI